MAESGMELRPRLRRGQKNLARFNAGQTSVAAILPKPGEVCEFS